VSTPDQIAVAKLMGRAQRYVWEKVPLDEALAGLREASTRGDLLAEAAGVTAGSAEYNAARPSAIAAARLLVQAGADRELLPKWIAVGRQRASRPSMFSTPRPWPDDLDQVLAEVLEAGRTHVD
jgi:hypothetical protein